jgi:putative NADH-flavin reductase
MKSILLIGLGRFGKHVAMHLHNLGHQVMAVDSTEERVNAVLPYVTEAQIGDSTNESFLSSLGIRNFDACIVAIGDNFQSSLETTSEQSSLSPALPVTFTRNFFCETVPIRSSTRNSSLRNGQRSASAPTTFLISSIWKATTISMR